MTIWIEPQPQWMCLVESFLYAVSDLMCKNALQSDYVPEKTQRMLYSLKQYWHKPENHALRQSMCIAFLPYVGIRSTQFSNDRKVHSAICKYSLQLDFPSTRCERCSSTQPARDHFPRPVWKIERKLQTDNRSFAQKHKCITSLMFQFHYWLGFF